MRFALKIFYLGKFEGFQRQADKETVEGYIVNALKESGLIKDLKSAQYISSGRTDKGVHALSQVIAVSTAEKIIIPAINSFLPDNIIIWAWKMVNEEFNPRYDALSRTYRYYTNYSNENIEKMREGARMLTGVHDFRFFTKKTPLKNTIRQIYQLEIEDQDPFLIFTIRGNSFLWQMVRRIVDTILKIGKGQWQLQDLRDLLNGNPRSDVFTEPRVINGPDALILWDVEYPFVFQLDLKSLNKVKNILGEYILKISVKMKYFKHFMDYFEIFG